MFKLLTALLVATAAVNAVPVSNSADNGKKAKPASYNDKYLENYDVYHCRYIAINCRNQHGTKFFDECCHPLLATETVQNNRPEKCWVQNHPAPETQYPACDGVAGAPTPVNPTTSSAPAPAPASGGDDGDDEEDCPTDEPAGPAPAVPAPAPAAPAPPPAAPADPAPSGNGGDSGNGGNGGDSGSGGNTGGSPNTGGGDAGGGDEHTGGFATFFFQGGNAGNCGNFNSDSSFVAALQTNTYANGANCGRTIHITNTNNGKSVDVTVADSCPTCDNDESIDLSQAAFDAIASESDGMVPITWHFTS